MEKEEVYLKVEDFGGDVMVGVFHKEGVDKGYMVDRDISFIEMKGLDLDIACEGQLEYYGSLSVDELKTELTNRGFDVK